MTDTSFSRLTALDAVFLAIEDESNLLHVAFTALFERAPLVGTDGTLDEARIRRYARSVLESLPKFRRRLSRVPLVRHPVLVDDTTFDVDHHLRFLRLERGDEAELHDLVGRIYSEPLDRSRPLWEQWYIDGLTGERVAVVTKAHHCLVDGVSGVAALSALLRTTRDASFEDGPGFEPAPAPPAKELLRAEAARLVQESAAFAAAARNVIREEGGLAGAARRAGRAGRGIARGVAFAAAQVLRPTSRTSINPSRIGSRRAFDWVTTDLAEAKAVKDAAGTKVNDVVLATVAGALRRYFLRRGEPVEGMVFRVMVPVSTHADGSMDAANRVALLVVPLPLSEPSPTARLRLVAASMRDAKASGEAQALAAGEKLADLTFFNLVTMAAKVAIKARPYNVIVTNVPGPPMALYLLGARLLGLFPMVPLYGNNAVGIALVSYEGSLCWGINADARAVPDPSALTEDLRASFEELRDDVLY